MYEDIEKVYYSEEELHAIVKRLGAQISKDYEGKKLLLVGILKGSMIFMADLMKEISVPCEIDFMRIASYGAGTSNSGNFSFTKDLETNIEGYDVLVVEDILDSGRTLSKIRETLLVRKPNSFEICTLLDKPERRVVPDIYAKYSGAEVPDEFVVGYGLDFAEKYRNLPYVGVLKRSVYATDCEEEK